eukprot:1369215-Amphidinium_carterae.2
MASCSTAFMVAPSPLTFAPNTTICVRTVRLGHALTSEELIKEVAKEVAPCAGDAQAAACRASCCSPAVTIDAVMLNPKLNSLKLALRNTRPLYSQHVALSASSIASNLEEQKTFAHAATSL